MSAFLSRVSAAGLLLLFAASMTPARQDEDPVYEGKKASVWVDTLINDSSARKRSLAVDALARLWSTKQYKNGLLTIGRALRLDASTAVRAQAAMVLGALSEDDIKKYVATDLIDSLGTEKEPRVRKEIAIALGRSPPVCKLAVTPLTAALKDKDAAIRTAAAEALAQSGSDGKPAAAALAPLLLDSNKGVRRAAVAALGRISPEGSSAIAETMARMLGSETDLDLKNELAISLGLLSERSPAVVAALAGALQDPDEELRRRATRTLGSFGVASAPVADALLKVSASDKVKDIRAEAIHAYGSALGADLKPRVRELLVLLKDPEFEVRLAVVEEVGALGTALKDDAETIKVLRSRLSDPHVKVREATAAAIKRIEKKPEPKKETAPGKEPSSLSIRSRPVHI